MMRRTRIRPVSLKRKSRVGKLGIERLVGKDMTKLRVECFRDCDDACVDCGRLLAFDEEESIATGLPIGQMAHKRTKRNNGDSRDNVQLKCPDCHHKEHNPKACPSKHQ